MDSKGLYPDCIHASMMKHVSICKYIYVNIWGFPKMVGFPNKPIGFPTKYDQNLGWRLGVPPFKETPIYFHISPESSSQSSPHQWPILQGD